MPHDESTVFIQLRARNGTVIGRTLIDSADADWVNQWCWRIGAQGYAARYERTQGRERIVLLHRELLGLDYGDVLEGDHINRDRLDNRRSNLRIVTKGQNGQNHSSHVGASSQYRGVSWDSKKRTWGAFIRTNGKTRRLGSFANEEDAARAALLARQALLPFSTE